MGRYLAQFYLKQENLQFVFSIQLTLQNLKGTNAFQEAQKTHQSMEHNVQTTQDNQNGLQEKTVQKKQLESDF